MTFLDKTEEEIRILMKKKEDKNRELEKKLEDVRKLREEIKHISEEISKKYAIKNRILGSNK